ncbi:MAG: TolC family protein [Leptospirales bacterium]|nr:TolC family protein [Leptospirales bacterium]
MRICVLAIACAILQFDVAYARKVGLSEAEQFAENGNVDLKALRAERAIADEGRKAKFRDFFPTMSLSYRRNRTLANRDFDSGSHSVQVSMSQPVYDGGRSGLAYEVAEIDVKLAQEKHSEFRNRLRFQIRSAYLAVLREKAAISIARTSLESSKFVFDKAVVERRQGSITELDFREIENEFARRKMDLKQAEDGLRDRQIELATILRWPADEELDIRDLDLFSLRPSDFKSSLEEMLQIALKERPDVRQARIDLMRSRREYLITEHDYLPTVALTGNYGKTGEEWPPRQTEWGVGVSFTFRIAGSTLSNDLRSLHSRNETTSGYSSGAQLNVYDNPGAKASHMRNEVGLMKAREKERQLEEQLRNEVTRLRRSYHDKLELVSITDRALAVKEQRFKIQQIQLRNGSLSVPRYIEEEIKLIEARSALVRERIELILTANQVELSLGLPVDSLALVDLKSIETEDPSAGRRAWLPHTNLNLPSKPGPGPKLEDET